MVKVMPCGFGKHLWSVTADGLQCYKNVCQSSLHTYMPMKDKASYSPRRSTDAPLPRRHLLLASHTRQAFPHRALSSHQPETQLSPGSLRYRLHLRRLHPRFHHHSFRAMQPIESWHHDMSQQSGVGTGHLEYQHRWRPHYHAGGNALGSSDAEETENSCGMYPRLGIRVSCATSVLHHLEPKSLIPLPISTEDDRITDKILVIGP